MNEDLSQPGNTGDGYGAYGRFSALPRPFLRWAGSKQALLPRLNQVLPKDFNVYYEPFLGSGALFFHLRPNKAVLSDASAELVDVWQEVKSNVDGIVKYLDPLKPDRDLFYQIRDNRSSDKNIKAGEFLYLNKTCWNGLYRVNSKGKFNVPYGSPRTDFIFDKRNLIACSKALNSSGVTILCGDFCSATKAALRGDFVYFDPPYVTKHNNNGFRDWNEKLFSWDDQIRLAIEAERLRLCGVAVVVSNAAHKDVVDLYPNFSRIEFSRSSTLSSSARFRGVVEEVILSANVG